MVKIYNWFFAQLACAVALSSNAVAAPSSDEIMKECAISSSIARGIMEKRQHGASMRQLMEDASRTEDEYMKGIKTLFIEQAFRVPSYESAERKSKAVDEFENLGYAGCYMALTGDKK